MDTVLTAGDDLSIRVKVTDSLSNVRYFTDSGIVGSAAGLVTEVTMGGVTYTFSEFVEAGLDLTGRAYVVDPGSGVMVTAISPAQTTDGGLVISGAEKNTFYGTQNNQGFDERFGNYTAGVNVPISMVQGDTLIKAVSIVPKPVAPSRPNGIGSFTDLAVLHCVSRAPAANEALGPTVKYNGTRNEFYTVDLDAWYAARTVFPHAGVLWDTYENMLDTVKHCWPTWAKSFGNSVALGYEVISPRGLGEYSREVNRFLSHIALAMTTNLFTEAQTKELAKKFLMHGIEWGDPFIYNTNTGVLLDAEGGHGQHFQMPVIFALGLTGRHALIPTFMAKAPGAYQSAWKMTDAFLDAFITGHTSKDLPFQFRRRTLPAQPGGTTLRLPMIAGNSTSGYDWYQNLVPANTRVIRVSDSVEATIASDFSPSNVPNNTNYTKDVTLTATNPFSEGDVVYMREPIGDHTFSNGTYWWSYTGDDARIHNIGFGSQGYQGTQNFMATLFILKALNENSAYTFWDTSLDDAMGYAEVAYVSNYPQFAGSLDVRWPDPFNTSLATVSTFFALNFDPAWSVITPLATTYGTGDWSLTDNADGTGLTLTVPTPNIFADNGGAALVDIEYDINASGTWVSIGPTNTAAWSTVIAPADGITIGVAADIRIRPVTAGPRPGPASTAKTATAT